MAAPPVSRSGFVPAGPPRVSVAADGALAAIQEAARITILALPSGAPFAQIGVDPEATASELGWVGAPGRLIVLSRYEAHSTVHLLDPHGPRTIAEIRLEQPMRLVASVGSTALVVGALGAAVLAATETHVTLYPFPTRSIPLAAGAAAAQIMVALPGSIEEWDPRSRMPNRRLRLPRVAAITAVGGSERLVWMATHEQPARIDVIPLINRGQPRAHDLPEPIARIAAHPRSDLLACVGAESGKLYVIDLDGRVPTYVVGVEGLERIESAALVVGRSTSVIVAQAGHPIAIVSLARRAPVAGEPRAPGGDAADARADEPDIARRSEEAARAAGGAAAEAPSSPGVAGEAAAPLHPHGDDAGAPLHPHGDEAGAPASPGSDATASSRWDDDGAGASSGGDDAAADLARSSLGDDAAAEGHARSSRTDDAAEDLARSSLSADAAAEGHARSSLGDDDAAAEDHARSSRADDAAEDVVQSTWADDAAEDLARSSRGDDAADDPAGARGRPTLAPAPPGARSRLRDRPMPPAVRSLMLPDEPAPRGVRSLALPDEPAVPRSVASRMAPSTMPQVGHPSGGSRQAGAAAAPIPRSAGAPSPPAQLRRGPSPPVAAGLTARPGGSASERVSAWRDLARPQPPRPEPGAPPGPAPTLQDDAARTPPDDAARIAAARDDDPASWRDEVVAWSRAMRAGALARDPPAAPPIEALAARFELAPELQPVLVLLYGAHLCGVHGVAPVEIAHLLDRQWTEALGRGELARHAIAIYAASRVELAPAALRMLDELPPATGTLVGTPGAVALLGPCVVVAGDEPLATIAARCLDQVGGAVLAAHPDADRAALAFEARVYGAAPMLRADAVDATSRAPTIVVAADAELADRLGVPRLA